MDSKVNYAFVGLVVIILSVALLATILWMTAATDQRVYNSYQVYIKESVSGLNRKALVKYRGVEVGEVTDIGLDPKRPSEVWVLLDIESHTPVKRDTMATLATQGLTGLAYIELSGGSVDAPAPEIKAGQRYPELLAKPSLLVRIDTAFSKVMKDFESISGLGDELLKNLNGVSGVARKLLSEENQQRGVQILEHIEAILHSVAARKENIEHSLVALDKTLENTAAASARLPMLLTKLEKTLDSVEQTTQQAHGLITDTRQDIKQTTQAVAQISKGLSSSVNNSRQNVDQFSRQALPEMAASLRELHDLLQSLRQFSRSLEQKPNMLLLGKPKSNPAPGE